MTESRARPAMDREPPEITLSVNDEEHRLRAEATRTLLEVLREDLTLTGSKRGCDQGVCGSCTVLCDGDAIRACLALAVGMAGRRIVTIEGAAEDATMAAVRQAFIDAGAVQCGYCTPGMIIAATALLGETPHPGIEEIRDGLSGNLCRCSGYVKIVDAVALAARRLGGEAAK